MGGFKEAAQDARDRMIVEETVEERVRALSKRKMSALQHGNCLELARAAAKSKDTVTLEVMRVVGCVGAWVYMIIYTYITT